MNSVYEEIKYREERPVVFYCGMVPLMILGWTEMDAHCACENAKESGGYIGDYLHHLVNKELLATQLINSVAENKEDIYGYDEDEWLINIDEPLMSLGINGLHRYWLKNLWGIETAKYIVNNILMTHREMYAG